VETLLIVLGLPHTSFLLLLGPRPRPTAAALLASVEPMVVGIGPTVGIYGVGLTRAQLVALLRFLSVAYLVPGRFNQYQV